MEVRRMREERVHRSPNPARGADDGRNSRRACFSTALARNDLLPQFLESKQQETKGQTVDDNVTPYRMSAVRSFNPPRSPRRPDPFRQCPTPRIAGATPRVPAGLRTALAAHRTVQPEVIPAS